MYRSFWQEMIDIIYDAMDNELNSQEEIDDIITEQFEVFSGFTQDSSEIPNDFDRRRRYFDDPTDLIRWIERGGIPPQCIFVHEAVLSDDERQYVAYVSEDSE